MEESQNTRQPSKRVSNSDIELELKVARLEIREQVRQAVVSVEEKIESKINGSNQRIEDLTNSLDGHLKYHKELVEAAEKLANKRFTVYTLLISVAMVVLTATSIIIGVLH